MRIILLACGFVLLAACTAMTAQWKIVRWS